MSAPSVPPPLTIAYEIQEDAIASPPSRWRPLGRLVLVIALVLAFYRGADGILAQIALADVSSGGFPPASYATYAMNMSPGLVQIFCTVDCAVSLAVVVSVVFVFLRFRAARYLVISGVGWFAAVAVLRATEAFQFFQRFEEYGTFTWSFVIYPLCNVGFALITGITLTRRQLFQKRIKG